MVLWHNVTMIKTSRPDYGPVLVDVLRRLGLLLPLGVAAYGALTMVDLAPKSPQHSDLAVFGTSLLFTTVGVLQYLFWPKRTPEIKNYLLVTHIAAIIFVVWVSGFSSPATYMWIPLAILTELHYGRAGLLASLYGFAMAFVLSLAASMSSSVDEVVAVVMTALVILAVILAFVQLRKVQRLEQRQLRRSRAEEQLQRGQLMSLVNSMTSAVITTNARGMIRLYNAALLNLLDTNNSLTGQRLSDAVHLFDQSGKPVTLEQLIDDKGRPFERDDLTLRLGEGDEMRVLIAGSPIRDLNSSIEGHIFLLRDITSTKSLEEERDEFISVVSHELRTPITIAEGTISNLQLLVDKGGKLKDLLPSLKDAHEQIIYLANMINDLGTLSRAERGVGDQPEDINLRQLVGDLFNRYQPAAAKKGLKFNLDAGHQLGTVSTSRLYLEEILQNFITNSIKYTPEGSVTLEVKRRREGVYFAVHDTGIGISKTDQKKVFEKFYRSEDYRTRETSGTGLGLYVTKKLVDKLGVEIKVSSRLNHGSTFSFVLKDKQ